MELSIKYNNKKLPLCYFNNYSIMGEEILIPNSTYQYTVTVKSDNAKVLFIDKDKIIARFKIDVINYLVSNYK